MPKHWPGNSSIDKYILLYTKPRYHFQFSCDGLKVDQNEVVMRSSAKRHKDSFGGSEIRRRWVVGLSRAWNEQLTRRKIQGVICRCMGLGGFDPPFCGPAVRPCARTLWIVLASMYLLIRPSELFGTNHTLGWSDASHIRSAKVFVFIRVTYIFMQIRV